MASQSTSSSSKAVVNTTANNPVDNKKWYTEDEHFEGVTIAYEAGKKVPYQEFNTKFKANIERAKSAGKALFQLLWSNGIICDKLHLRNTSYNCFDILVVLSEKDYLSDKFDTSYKLSKNLENDGDDFKLRFHFLPKNKNIDIKAINSDGFKLTFGIAPKE